MTIAMQAAERLVSLAQANKPVAEIGSETRTILSGWWAETVEVGQSNHLWQWVWELRSHLAVTIRQLSDARPIAQQQDGISNTGATKSVDQGIAGLEAALDIIENPAAAVQHHRHR